MEASASTALLDEMRSVKRLLVLQALMMGCQQKHVAAALEVSEATLSRMFPKGFAKDLAEVAGRERHTTEMR
jgi:hypothetical protein